MRLIMTENIPSVWLSDGFFFIEALFTKEAISEFRKNFSHLKFSHLRDKIVYVQRWSLQLRQRDSAKHYQTYNNLTVLLCVEQFKLISHEVPSTRQIHAAQNLHMEEEIRTMLDNLRHAFISTIIETKYQSIDEFGDQLGLGSQAMPSLKDVFKPEPENPEAEEEVPGSKIAASGIVRLNFTTPASVATYAMGSRKSRLSEDMIKVLRMDTKDFNELEWHLNDETMNGAAGGGD